MNLPEKKRVLYDLAASDRAGKYAGKLGRLCSTVFQDEGNYTIMPDELGGRISRQLLIHGYSSRFLSFVFPDKTILDTGYQSIVFGPEDGIVEKYIKMSLGKSATTADAFYEYERDCIVAVSEVFGDMLAIASPKAFSLRMRPLGRVSASGSTQEYIIGGINLFADDSIEKIRSSTGNNFPLAVSNIERFLELDSCFADNYGAHIDVVGDSNVVVIPDGTIKIIDYDPNIPSNYRDLPKYSDSAEERLRLLNRMRKALKEM